MERPFTTQGDAETTVQYTFTGNVAKTLDGMLIDHADVSGTYRKMLVGALITCKGNAARFAFVTAPVAGTTGLGHELAVGQSIFFQGVRTLKAIQFINQTDGSFSILDITPFYNPKRT